MYIPRWYQAEAKQAIYSYFENGGEGNPVVAMPTGTGKAVVIADTIADIFRRWPSQSIIKLTHVKELISQNADKLTSIWPNAPLGIYSAGLKERSNINPVVFGGVQSVAKAMKRGESFGRRDLVFIDECHLLSPEDDTQYQYVIDRLKEDNPKVKVVGFTATPYRLKQGLITDGGLFTDICYDITGVEAFNRLVEEGYLAKLVTKKTSAQVDLSNVHIRAGEYVEKEQEEAWEGVTYEACKELCAWGYDRNSWLLFASSVKHAETIESILQGMGIHAACVHSKLGAKENDRRIKAFKEGYLRCLINCGKLTTGFDHPPIDLIGVMRATNSPGLWVQILGRGIRPYNPEFAKYIPNFDYIKRDCLVLDFAGNAKRLGPINDPVLPRKPGQKTGEAPIRICPECSVYNHAAARHCCNCGLEFTFEMTLYETAGSEEVMKTDSQAVEYVTVQKVLYNLHQKEGSPPSIKVSYFCGDNPFQTTAINEWICLEHPGFAGKKARDWWRQRHNEEPPQFTFEALNRTTQLKTPSKLRIIANQKHPEVIGYEF